MTPGDRLNPPRGFHAVILVLFFPSGFVVLLYQVIWQRLLALVIGLDLYAVTPTSRIQHTFMNVFRHVVEVPPILIGSNQPIAIDAEAIRARTEDPFTAAYYARAGIPLQEHVTRMLGTAHHRERPVVSATDAMLNTSSRATSFACDSHVDCSRPAPRAR